MFKRSVVAIAVIGLLCSASLPLEAQTTTGRLRGTVSDSEGQAFPGVTVTVSSSILMGGTRNAITGDSGAYRFTALPPGVYAVLAEMDGHQSQLLESVRVEIGGTASANFVLYSEFTEVVTISSEAPLVDVSSSSSGTTFSADFIEDLPTTRNFYDLMTVAPGVSLATEDSSRVVAFGSDVQSNAWYTDGIEVTGPETGTSWVSINPDMIEEIQVLGIGAPAEYGNMLGAALNVVTKSGSNELKGSLNAYYFDNSLVDSDIQFGESEFREFEQEEFWDVTGTLGGPLKKDRLWFLVGYEYWRDGHTFPGGNPGDTSVWFQDRYDLKLSARLNDSNEIEFKGGFNDWGFPTPPDPFTTQSAAAGEVGDDTVWGLNFQSVVSDRTLFEARYAGWESNDDFLSQTGSTEAAFIDFTPAGGGPETFSGGVWWPWSYDTSTNQVSASMSHFADDLLKGEHDFKFGIQANEGDAITVVSPSATGTYYYHYDYQYEYYGYIYDYSWVKVEGAPYYYGNEQEAIGVFIDDSWSVNERLTLNLGVRYDRHEGITPAFPVLDAFDSFTGEVNPGFNPLFTWENISPRVGFAYNAGKELDTVIRGSFGIYYNGNVGGNWNSPPPLPPVLTAYASTSGPDGPFDVFWWDFSPGVNNVDPDLEAPETTQFSFGVEKSFNSKYAIGIMGVYKDSSNNIGWEFVDEGVFEEVQFTDPINGDVTTVRHYSEFPTVRKGNRPGFTAAGFLDDYWAEYKGVLLTFNRRFADWWGMQASYTYSESRGLNPRALSQWQNNPLYGSKEGANANQYFNIDGARMTGDRPHMLRVQGNFELPWNLHANTNINLQSGRPYFRRVRGEYPTTASRQNYFIAEGFRHPFQKLVDFTIGKRFSLGDGGELKIDLQFFNLLNDDATDFFETTTLSAGEFFLPDTWVKPRRVMLHLGVSR